MYFEFFPKDASVKEPEISGEKELKNFRT